MKKILKIGDQVYTQSLQHFSPSFFKMFPQREQFLFEHLKSKLKFEFFRHKVIRDWDDIAVERKKLTGILENNRFDFILIDNPFSALVLEKSIKTPIIFDCIDWYDEMYLKEFGVNKGYYLLRYAFLDLLKRADKVIAQSPVILEALKKWGLKTKNCVVIPNGYDKKLFYSYSQAKISELKKLSSKKYRIDLKDKKIVVYTGKLNRWYENIKIIAQAIGDDQVFFIVGDGPLLKKIPDRKNIVKCGAVSLNEVSKYTNIADVLVFPVDVDCSPIAISEYLAVGKPIVMGKGRMEWLLKNGQTGYMVDNNVYSWKKGIQAAIENKNMIGKFNRRLSKNFSWEYLSKKFIAFVNEK